MSTTLLSLKKGGNSHLKLKLRKSREDFINQSNEIHNNKYNYDLVVYVRNEDYVIIECKEHGYFLQSPKTHIKGRGCKKCGGEKRRLTTETFIEKANTVHSNKYDYSESVYVLKKIKVKIICPIHGVFTQSPSDHLNGSGCQECAKHLTSWRRSQYSAMAEKHGGYSNVYLIKMTNKNESFYKIGITVFNINERYWGERGYKVDLVSSVTMLAITAWDKEREIHAKLKELRYSPAVKFGGHTECFSELTQEVKDFFGVK